MFSQIDNDIFLCGAYIHPKNTTHNILSKTDYFGDLHKAVLKYAEKGNLLIFGDLNVRTGLSGKSRNSLHSHLQSLLPEVEPSSLELNRCSCDDKIESSGMPLPRICNHHNLRISNGETPGDSVGNQTCYN